MSTDSTSTSPHPLDHTRSLTPAHSHTLTRPPCAHRYTMVKPAYVASSADDSLPWRLVAKEAGGGLIMDVGCHTIDICDFIVGPFNNVAGCATQSAGAPYAVEDGVALTARFNGRACQTSRGHASSLLSRCIRWVHRHIKCVGTTSDGRLVVPEERARARA